MFGSKFRSWMEAVRPKKKQQRKDKQKSNSKMVTNIKPVKSYCSSENEILEDVVDSKSMQTISSHAPRYSGANLSSPESAYSTGYSTDGTSPGAPPEYYINIRTGTRYFPSVTPENDDRPSTQIAHVSPNLKEDSPKVVTPTRTKLSPRHNASPRIDRLSTVAVRLNGECTTVSMTQDYEGSKNSQARASVTLHNNLNATNGVVPRLTEVIVNSGITSPRQRNRIRTNPWLPGNNLSPGSSSIGLHMRTDHSKNSAMNSPVPAHYLSPTVPCSPINKSTSRYESSSSSCSSLSASSLHWDSNLVRQIPEANSASDEEDDCTLNEMMGKYDESYVYEKETDILSDSDPTDCETDIDTGQDGGDEDDPLEREFDFIDNGSFLDFNIKDERNTGHCTYYNFEIQRKCSRRRTSKRTHKQEGQNQIVSKQASDRRRRSNCSKKRQRHEGIVNMQPCAQSNGSKSAGATPLSVRRTKYPLSKVALEDRLKKRSNSISFSRDPVSTFDQRDKEADKKYKELIVEAEHILMSMKQGALSPRRLPGPANKRVELLRTESVKPDSFIKNRLIEDISNMHLSKIPSNVLNFSRCSPKKNHITNFINNNSPILLRRESERTTSLDVKSPLGIRKEQNMTANSSPVARKKPHGKTDSRRSPKYRKKMSKTPTIDKRDSSTSDSECERKPKRNILSRNNSEMNGFTCPQSEPVKRKVYNHQTKTVAFNLNYESVCNLETNSKNNFDTEERVNGNGSMENLRQQVLLNTIANLKKSLENQSASLKQARKQFSSDTDLLRNVVNQQQGKAKNKKLFE